MVEAVDTMLESSSNCVEVVSRMDDVTAVSNRLEAMTWAHAQDSAKVPKRGQGCRLWSMDVAECHEAWESAECICLVCCPSVCGVTSSHKCRYELGWQSRADPTTKPMAAAFLVPGRDAMLFPCTSF